MRASGFTLIELICVIVILGCLTAIAMPRWLDLSDAAERVSVAKHAQAFTAAVQFVRMRYDLNRKSGAVDNLAGFGSGNVDTNTAGFPTDTANANTIPNNLTGANRCRNVFNGILTAPAPICGGTVACNDSHDFQARTVSAQTCRFDYIEDTTPARFFVYSATTGVVSTTNP
jgi:MSHA pilin protein MshB